MSGRTISITAVAWIATFSPVRADVLLYDNQVGAGSGMWSERNTVLGGEATLADDFVISDLPVSITRIEALFFIIGERVPMAGVDVLLFDEAPEGGPGGALAELLDVTDVTQEITPTEPFDHWLDALDISLAEPIVLPPGRYYLGLRGVGPDPDLPVRYAWTGDPRLGERESYFRSDVLGYPEWTPMSEVMEPVEASFRLYGDIIPAPPALVIIALALPLVARTKGGLQHVQPVLHRLRRGRSGYVVRWTDATGAHVRNPPGDLPAARDSI